LRDRLSDFDFPASSVVEFHARLDVLNGVLALEVSAYRRVRTSMADLLKEAVRDLHTKYEE
jgi:hypothetical protein